MRSPRRSRDTAVCAEVHARHPTVPSVNKHGEEYQCRMQEDLMQWRMGRVERIQKSQSCSNGTLLPAEERGTATQPQPLLSEAQDGHAADAVQENSY